MNRIVLFVLVTVFAPNIAGAQQWKKLSTVREVVEQYPDRIQDLLRSLDLSKPGLEQVNAAYSQGDAIKACEELLAYYRNGKSGSYLRRQHPATSSKRDSAADLILKDIFRFYELSDRVPRTADGRLDWSHEGPDHDIEWAWGLNRHGHLISLMGAYFRTGNPVYAETINTHVQDWVVSSLPYPRVNSRTAMWRGLEVALRAKVWVRVFYALINTDYLSPATQILMLTSVPEHTHYLRNFHAAAGNWLTMEMSGLAMVATAWPEFKESRKWVEYSKAQMLDGLKDQVYPDGVQKELTSHYHQVALNNFRHFRDICDEAGEPLPDEYRSELEKMAHYIAVTVSPSGYGLLNNDSDHRYNRSWIEAAAETYGREDWLFIATNGKKGKRPSGSPSVVFPWAGQLVMRSDYDADAHWAFFDVGAWGTGHQHNDKLHISVSAYGRDLLVDGGRFAYRGELANKFRKYATGSASHNVVLIDGQGQSPGPHEAREPLSDNQHKITESFDYASGSFDKFDAAEGNAVHTRSVFYMRGKFWIVVDKIETDRKRKIEALWHWHPKANVRIGENGIVSTHHDKGNLKIIPVDYVRWKVTEVKGAENPPQGWYSERYNLSEPAPVSIYSTEINGTSSFVWVLFPSEKDTETVRARIVSSDSDKIRVRVVDQHSNEWEVDVPYQSSADAGYSFKSALVDRISDKRVHDQEGARKLLSRLDLNRSGLEEVRKHADNPSLAIDALLSYYRSRSGFKHLIDREQRKAMRGKCADEATLERANDALKHILIGQRAYPAYYCGDDINWGFRPVPDNEWVWQLNRMGFWDDLALAYWHTGDERYAHEWALQLVDWTIKNPRDDAHGYAWRSIEAGIRGYNWTGLFQRFIDSPAFTPEVLVAFLNSCYDHASYLMTVYKKRSNWGLMEAEGMAFIAMTFPEFSNALQWRTEAISRLNQEIENQVYPDGHQRELAIGYHTSSITWFKRTYDLAHLNGLTSAFPDKYLATIEKMCEVPMKLGFPDGTNPQFGDAWRGSPGQIWPKLREWSKLFKREDFLYVASEGREGRKPGATAFALEQSGLYSMRSDWTKDAICLLLKCGPDGGAHSQPDNGTFELYAGGRDLMPDAGSYIYSGDPEGRRWFRQTKVHQTLTLDGENSAYAPRQLLWKPGKQDDILVVENASYPGLTHRRAVIFVDKKYFVIVDEAFGNATGDVDIHFQFAPGQMLVDSATLAVRSNFQEGWNVMVQTVKQRDLTLDEEEGWVSYKYTIKEPRPAFRYRLPKTSSGGVRFVTVVIPFEGTVPPEVDAEITGNPAVGSSKMQLKVGTKNAKRKIRYFLPN